MPGLSGISTEADMDAAVQAVMAAAAVAAQAVAETVADQTMGKQRTKTCFTGKDKALWAILPVPCSIWL